MPRYYTNQVAGHLQQLTLGAKPSDWRTGLQHIINIFIMCYFKFFKKNPLISVWCCNFLPRFSSQTAPEENSNVTSPTKNVQGNQAIIMTWKVYLGTAHSLGLKETLTVLSPTSHSHSWVCWWLCSLPEWFWAPPKVLNVYRSFARY